MRLLVSITLLTLFAHVPASAQDAALSVRAMSFNIRYNNPGDGIHAWPNRADEAARTIAFWDADVAGLQEALRGQIDDVSMRLPDYAWLGVGRDDGADAGEFSPIFYKRDRFNVVEQGTFWLSPTPDEVGSQGWDAALPRIATWAHLQDKATEARFLIVNTHFDHVGEEARVQSAQLIRSRLENMPLLRLPDIPIILMGDFNVTPDHAAYAALTSAHQSHRMFYDARHVARRPAYGPEGTFSGFTVGEESDRRIDYIFTSAAWSVERYGVLNAHREGRYPSDHLPVVAELLWMP